MRECGTSCPFPISAAQYRVVATGQSSVMQSGRRWHEGLRCATLGEDVGREREVSLDGHMSDACLALRPTSKDEDALQLVAQLRSPWTTPIPTALPCLTAVLPAWHRRLSGHSSSARVWRRPFRPGNRTRPTSWQGKRHGGVQNKPLGHSVQRSRKGARGRPPACISSTRR